MADPLPAGGSTDAQSDQFPASVSRRWLCRGVAVMAVPLTAGCSAPTDLLDGNPGEITVFNNTDSTITVTITVTNPPGGTEILSDTTEIPASEATRYNDVFESATQYRFRAERTDGLSGSHQWELPSTEHYLYIIVEPDSIEFEEHGP